MNYPIECALCSVTFNIHVTHSHLRATHSITLAAYRSMGFEPVNRAFYTDGGSKRRMADHPYWKGGRRIGKNGYVYIRHEGDYALEHRLVMESHLGRKLTHDEHIHHRDGNKTNNALDNLEVIDSKKHVSMHGGTWWGEDGARRDKHPRPQMTCAQCGVHFTRSPSRFGRGQKNLYCSRTCMGLHRRDT